MTEKKLTDEEIITALKCCAELDYTFKICEEKCPYKGKCHDKETGADFLKDVLDLIDRLKGSSKR